MRHNEYNGKIAVVRYRGGAVGEPPIEDYFEGEPQQVHIGAGEVPPGVDELLYDMEIGEIRDVIIPAAKAYGAHDPDGVQVYPRWYLPCGETLQAGEFATWTHPVTKVPVPVKCVAATQDTVTIDFNHLLAGKDLAYRFELLDVI